MNDLLISLGSFAIIAAFFAAVLRQAGCSGWWAVLMVVPLVNLMVLAVFALRQWPVSRELARRRVADGDGGEDDCFSVFSQAEAAERDGDRERAGELYRTIVDHAPECQVRGDAALRLRGLGVEVGEA